MKRRRRIKQSTCFILGMIGALATLAAGILVLISPGPANLLYMLGFALTGGMLLFLATTEKGEGRNRRITCLLLLFAALVVSYSRLPPLDLLEGLVIPFVAVLYRKKGDWLLITPLALVEAAYVVCRMLQHPQLLRYIDWAPAWLLGALMIAVGLLRGVVLFLLYRRRANEAPAIDENEAHSLR